MLNLPDKIVMMPYRERKETKVESRNILHAQKESRNIEIAEGDKTFDDIQSEVSSPVYQHREVLSVRDMNVQRYVSILTLDDK